MALFTDAFNFIKEDVGEFFGGLRDVLRPAAAAGLAAIKDRKAATAGGVLSQPRGPDLSFARVPLNVQSTAQTPQSLRSVNALQIQTQWRQLMRRFSEGKQVAAPTIKTTALTTRFR